MNTIQCLTITTTDGNTLSLSREGAGRLPEREFSVTLDGPESSWGEFLSPSDLALVAAWASTALEEWLKRPLEVPDA